MSDADFPIIDQIRQAPNNRTRASILLTIPDAIYLKYGLALQQALIDVKFAGGAQFVFKRELALHATRDANGLLRDDMARDLEHWRTTLVKFAAGEKLDDAQTS